MTTWQASMGLRGQYTNVCTTAETCASILANRLEIAISRISEEDVGNRAVAGGTRRGFTPTGTPSGLAMGLSRTSDSRRMSRLDTWQVGHIHSPEVAACCLLTTSGHSTDPTAPSEGVGKNADRASSNVEIPQAGCQDSGWKVVAERQIRLPTSNRPLGVKNTMSGGCLG